MPPAELREHWVASIWYIYYIWSVNKLKLDYKENDFGSGSLRSKVFNQLQNDIINGYYEPGDSLIEAKLSPG